MLPTEGALGELLGRVALRTRYEKKEPCQTLVGSAQQQATGLAAGSWPRAKQLKVFV